jgi:F420-dependent oxidoreductase-like protein
VKLGVALGYWGSGPPAGTAELVAEAERLGCDSIWTAEAYGSDALTPLAWLGSRTTSLRLGTGIMQMSARTPAATAMAAMTMDHLSDGRFLLGLGVSGPQVVEGWYGQAFGKPLARTREYIAVIRAILAREGPVEFHGEYVDMPLRGGTGLGKALKPTVHPLRDDLPIVLGAEGPKNIALAAEICDGWLPVFYSPRHDQHHREALAEGFAREGARRGADDFEVLGVVPVIPGDDVDACADAVRPFLALYMGGMGSRQRNFHKDVFVRMGFGEIADHVQDLYLAGRKEEAARAIPTSLCEEVALLGPPAKLREEIGMWNDSLLTTMLVTADIATLRCAAELLL